MRVYVNDRVLEVEESLGVHLFLFWQSVYQFVVLFGLPPFTVVKELAESTRHHPIREWCGLDRIGAGPRQVSGIRAEKHQ